MSQLRRTLDVLLCIAMAAGLLVWAAHLMPGASMESAWAAGALTATAVILLVQAVHDLVCLLRQRRRARRQAPVDARRERRRAWRRADRAAARPSAKVRLRSETCPRCGLSALECNRLAGVRQVDRPGGVIAWRGRDGQRHRAGGPAVIGGRARQWWLHGELELEEFYDGTTIHYEKSICHHPTEPAIVRPDGSVEWWWQGERVSRARHALLRMRERASRGGTS